MASDGEISCNKDPNFAVIYSFLKVFGKLYGLEVPSLTKLQEVIENTEEVPELLKELHLRLLRRALKSVQSTKWEKALIKLCHQRGFHQEAWEIERFSYKKASTAIKLKVLKFLLEHQFTCHSKFKSAVNGILSKELRLDPIGIDKNGCVYWLQVDDDANLCLYKEDQDEETWQLIARNREEFVRVIAQLKKGEDVCPPTSNDEDNEECSDAQAPDASPKLQNETKTSDPDDDNEDEFLSPESESDHDSDDLNELPMKASTDNKEQDKDGDKTNTETGPDSSEIPTETITVSKNENVNATEDKLESVKISEQIIDQIDTDKEKTTNKSKVCSGSELVEINKEDNTMLNVNEKQVDTVSNNLQDDENEKKHREENSETQKDENKINSSLNQEDSKQVENNSCKHSDTTENNEKDKVEVKGKQDNELFSEAIEEPVMVIKGEGNGADCESFLFVGEEICEPVMYIFGEGDGYDNETGNPEIIENDHNVHEDSENENEVVENGELNHEVSSVMSKTRSGKCVNVNSSVPVVNKRVLKKQSNDNGEEMKSDPKKHCVRENSETSNAKKIKQCNTSNSEKSESPCKNNVKKSRTTATKVLDAKTNEDNGNNSKTSIIEKRKSSISSLEQDDVDHIETEKEKTPVNETKVDDSLPPKKLRLETSPESDVSISHSKGNVNKVDHVDKEEINMINMDVLNNGIAKVHCNNDVSKRKKIKARKGKNRRLGMHLKDENPSDSNDEIKNKDIDENDTKKVNKSLKRTIMDATMSDKNKSESQSETDNDEPVTSGKRLKIKPKKIITSTRKKVEAKLQDKNSTDESEEETLYSLGKKSAKKVVKKKSKVKEKQKAKVEKKLDSDDSDVAPVRQSRRIAQMKIKEEAERRHLEEVALRELKKIHKKKDVDDDEEEEWKASGGASSSDAESAVRKRRADVWRPRGDSTGPEPDSESDEPLFEHQHVESDLDFSKSDHEFSPESDLESGEPAEPAKLARTLQEGKDDGFCKRCGSGEQPEWILLCDGCDAGYHASCLKPMLFLVPEGDWFCPQCSHQKLIASLEKELVKYDELAAVVEAERAQKLKEQPPPVEVKEKESKDSKSEEEESGSGSDWSTSDSEEGAVYRLRARKQLPVSYRAQEYDRLISSAIKEEYVEPVAAAGNQGRGKDISTIIEAAEEEKMKAEREAQEQGKPMEKKKKKQRRKPRKLNSLEVPSEDDDETDEDFKDTGMESSSESISSSAEKESTPGSSSSDDLPIRRTARTDKKERAKLTESSPEVKKKKNVINSSSESGEAKDLDTPKKSKKSKRKQSKRRDGSSKKSRRSRGLTQYDAAGNVVRARVTYGGLSGDDENDWSPKHRTRQRKINYTEMPNTDSEDEMHKSSGKHMPDSSDEFKISSDDDSDSECDRARKKKKEEEELNEEEKKKALCDLIKKTAVVPLEKLPDDVTKEKIEELQAHLSAQSEASRPLRGKGSRGGRGSRGPRGRGRGRASTSGAAPVDPDDELAKLVGVKIKDLSEPAITPLQAERERKRQEREAKQVEKEAKRAERLQKKEEKDRMKEQKAKEREEKRLARIALQENKRVKKDAPMQGFHPIPVRAMNPDMQMPMYQSMQQPPRHPVDYHEQNYNTPPRLQVRAELRGMLKSEDRLSHTPHQVNPMQEGTLSVAGSPQPFKPVSEEPSVITRMPHMLNQQYRGPMYPTSNSPYGPRQNMMYHPALNHPQNMSPRGQYPPQYYPHMRGLPPGYQQQGLRNNASSPGLQHNQMMRHGNPHPLMQQALGPPATNPHAIHHAAHMYPPIQGPPGSSSHRPPMQSILQTHLRHNAPMGHQSPNQSPANMPLPPATSPSETPIKIKAEVKTEPEYNSPPGSPSQRPPSPKTEPPRNHPKIKHTENKDRRPRFPLGPYAPQYGPYGPYAPQSTQPEHSILNLQSRMPVPNQPQNVNMQAMQRLHQGLHQYPSSSMDKPDESISPRLGQHMERPGPHMDHPGSHMDRPGSHMDRPGPHMDRPGPHMDRPGPHMDRPGPHMDRPGPHVDRPGPHMERPGTHMDHPGPHVDRPGPHMDRPGPHMDRLGPHVDRPGPHMDRPGVHMDRPGPHMDRPGPHMDRPGPHMDRLGPHMDRPGPHMDRPGPHMDRTGPHMDHPGSSMDRPGPNMERLGSNTDRPGPHMERLGLHVDRPGLHMEQRPGAQIEHQGQQMERVRPHLERPGPNMERLGPHMERPPGPHMERAGPHVEHLGPNIERPRPHMEQSGSHIERPGPHMERSGPHIDQPGPHIDRPGPFMERPGSQSERLGPQMERSGPQMDRLPSHLERPSSQPGSHLERPPPHMDRTGPQMERLPPHMERPGPLSERPGQHSDRLGSPIDRPLPHMDRPPSHMDRPGQHMEPLGRHLDRPMSHLERPPHPLLHHEMSHLPPHYLPHLRPQLRPQYGMPMLQRHPQPERSSPGVPPHFPPQYHEMHRQVQEKPMPAQHEQKSNSPRPLELSAQIQQPILQQAPVLMQPGPMQPSPVSMQPSPVQLQPTPTEALNLNESNRQKATEIKQELKGDQPSPDPQRPQLMRIVDHLNKPPDNEPIKQELQEIKTEDRQDEGNNGSPPPKEGSVFISGLFSYLSSQREDDIDV